MIQTYCSQGMMAVFAFCTKQAGQMFDDDVVCIAGVDGVSVFRRAAVFVLTADT